MGGAWVVSFIFHALVAVALVFGLPSFGRPPVEFEEVVTVELIGMQMRLERASP